MFLPTRRTRSKRTEHTCRTYYALTLLHAQPGGCRCAVVAAISVNTTEGWISIVGTIHINDFTFQTLAALDSTHFIPCRYVSSCPPKPGSAFGSREGGRESG